jgi:hypothetical protein
MLIVLLTRRDTVLVLLVGFRILTLTRIMNMIYWADVFGPILLGLLLVSYGHTACCLGGGPPPHVCYHYSSCVAVDVLVPLLFRQASAPGPHPPGLPGRLCVLFPGQHPPPYVHDLFPRVLASPCVVAVFVVRLGL